MAAQVSNPYFVDPMGGYGPAIIQGIGGIAKGYREQQAEEQAAQAKQAMATEAQSAFDSGDPNQVASLMMKYPDMRDTITAAVGHRDEATKQNMSSTIRAILANPDKAGQIMQSRVDSLGQVYGDDVDMYDTLGSIEEYKQDPEGFLNKVEMMAPAYLDEQEWKAYSEKRKPKEGFTLGPGQQRFDAQGKPIAGVAPKPVAFQLKPGEQRYEDGKLVATGAPVAAPTTPPALLAGLDSQVASQAGAAFVAAGGGKDGVAALGKVIDSAGEQQRRIASPQILEQNFPKASGAELQQLQATMDAAKTTESGLKEAQKIRTDQIRLKKGKEFQLRAIDLLTSILENPELADVIGGQEGTGEGFFFGKQIYSDFEADAVSDIEEATSILTSGNLDLLSGVLSDTDIGLLKDLSSGALKRVRSEKRFRADVQKLIEKLSSKLVVTVDDTETDRQGGDVNQRRERLEELRARARQ